MPLPRCAVAVRAVGLIVRSPVSAGMSMSMFIALTACALTACASSPKAQDREDAFDGQWSVRWCDKTAPDADCGGFTVDLAQDGDQIKGESSGARVRLTQIDEGGLVHGIAVGDTAVLTVESLRSGAIYLVRATVRGDCMVWKMRDTVRPAQQDIDIVAFDDVLERKRGDTPAGPSRPACRRDGVNR
ncbi:MAG: hypothetical protein E6Q88_14325 [Lysobacteraceae bacterium]|nr:MAG: hypothetical protein E6Q88_14325 [Xanthomonadaceae bacterium]